MKISYTVIRGCDNCGDDETLQEGECICDRCKERLKPKWRKEREEAITAFRSNHPDEPLPQSWLEEI